MRAVCDSLVNCPHVGTGETSRTCGQFTSESQPARMLVRWKPHDLSWTELAKRVWAETQGDDVFGNAAKLAYYFLLALFPLLIFLTSIIGIIIGSGSGMRHVLFNYLARVMPSDR